MSETCEIYYICKWRHCPERAERDVIATSNLFGMFTKSFAGSSLTFVKFRKFAPRLLSEDSNKGRECLVFLSHLNLVSMTYDRVVSLALPSNNPRIIVFWCSSTSYLPAANKNPHADDSSSILFFIFFVDDVSMKTGSGNPSDNHRRPHKIPDMFNCCVCPLKCFLTLSIVRYFTAIFINVCRYSQMNWRHLWLCPKQLYLVYSILDRN